MSLHVESTGSGPPLVLVHGWGFTGRVWEDLKPALQSHWQLHIADLPGFGRSTAAAGGHRLEAVADRLTVATPPRAVWVGWSLGGQVMLEIARRAPEHLGAAVLVASNPRFTRIPEWPDAVDPATFREFARTVEAHPARTLEQFISLCALGGDNARHTIRYLRERTTPIGQPGRAALAAGLRMLADADVRAPLASLRCPALLISGARDPLVPAHAARAMRELQPALRHAEIAGAAHAPFVSNRDEFLSILDRFLRENHVA